MSLPPLFQVSGLSKQGRRGLPARICQGSFQGNRGYLANPFPTNRLAGSGFPSFRTTKKAESPILSMAQSQWPGQPSGSKVILAPRKSITIEWLDSGLMIRFWASPLPNICRIHPLNGLTHNIIWLCSLLCLSLQLSQVIQNWYCVNIRENRATP